MNKEPSDYEAYLAYLYETFMAQCIGASQYRRFPDGR